MSNLNTNTYTSKNYSIVLSLNERTIYFKITDTVSFYQYEGNVDIKELRLNIELKDAYTIITNCFENNTGYNVVISINSNILKLHFSALVGGFLKMEFEVLLREKVMSNDGQLTINFNRLEQRLSAGLSKLENRCKELEDIIEKKNMELLDLTDKLSNAHICMCFSSHPMPEHFIPLNVKVINNFNGGQTSQTWRFDLIEKFYQLEKLTTTGFLNTNNLSSVKMKNSSLKELNINNGGRGEFVSLQGIEGMPNLERLTITQAPNLTNIPFVLKSYKHKINYIKIQTCGQVNVVELQTYCQTNNIKLEIS